MSEVVAGAGRVGEESVGVEEVIASKSGRGGEGDGRSAGGRFGGCSRS